MTSTLPREYALRAKTGTPSQVAQYLAIFINKVVQEVPPKFTHTRDASASVTPGMARKAGDWIDEVAEMTDDNHHTEARLLIAEKLGDKRLEKVMQAIITIEAFAQELPPGLSQVRYKAEKQLLYKAEQRLDAETYARLIAAL